MKNMILIYALIALVGAISASAVEEFGPISISSEPCRGDSCYCDITKKIIEVHNGDTMSVEDLGLVKLAGIISPDISTEEGKQAKSYLASLVLNKEICFKVFSNENTSNGATSAIAYLVDPDGSLDTSSSINSLILDLDSVQVDPSSSEDILNKILGITSINVTEEVAEEG